MSRYDTMSHAELIGLRNSLPDADPRQAAIAPYEHQAFAREWVQSDPYKAIPSLSVAIPGYALAKLLGFQRARTPASLGQVIHGYQGMGQGIAALLGVK